MSHIKLPTQTKRNRSHRNNLLPYYPKEYALRELTQLYSFTGLKIIQNEPHLKKQNKMITPPKIKTQNQSPPKTIHKTIKNPQNKEKIEK